MFYLSETSFTLTSNIIAAHIFRVKYGLGCGEIKAPGARGHATYTERTCRAVVVVAGSRKMRAAHMYSRLLSIRANTREEEDISLH